MHFLHTTSRMSRVFHSSFFLIVLRGIEHASGNNGHANTTVISYMFFQYSLSLCYRFGQPIRPEDTGWGGCSEEIGQKVATKTIAPHMSGLLPTHNRSGHLPGPSEKLVQPDEVRTPMPARQPLGPPTTNGSASGSPR